MITQRRLASYFSHNWGLKLLSFILALVVWFALIPEEKTFQEKTLNVPLEIHNTPAGMELVERPPQEVTVTIRAPNRLIPEISPANISIVLDLQRATVAQRQYALERNNISIPEGAEVKDIYPSQVSLKLELTREIMLEVEPDIIGTPPEGFTLGKVEVVPPQVAVRGPESKVRDDIKVRTTAVNVSELTQSTEVEARLILPNPDLRLAGFKTVVRVKLLIQKEGEEEIPDGDTPPTKTKAPTKKKKPPADRSRTTK